MDLSQYPNSGRLINIVDGVQGVSTGPSASLGTINYAADRRVHNIRYQLQSVNYTGGTLLATKHLTGGGNDALVVTLAVSAFQVPTTVTATTAGNGYNVGDTFSVVDATGTGAVFTVATLTGGAGSGVATATYNANSATASPVDPGLLCGIVKQSVNAVALRDVSARRLIMICQANGKYPRLGELPCWYTEPWLDDLSPGNDSTSWDLKGQNSFAHQIQFNQGYLLPGIQGIYEYDYERNLTTVNGSVQPNLQPVIYHEQTFNVGSGMTPLTGINTTYPIRRMWFIGSTPGNITQLQILNAGTVWAECTTVSQINNRYQDEGFQFGAANYLNQNQTAAKPLGFNPINYFDTAAIFDVDQRYSKSLKVIGKNPANLTVRVWSAIAQTVSVVLELLPPAYQA